MKCGIKLIIQYDDGSYMSKTIVHHNVLTFIKEIYSLIKEIKKHIA